MASCDAVPMGWQPLTREHARCRNTFEIKGPFTQIFFSLSSFRHLEWINQEWHPLCTRRDGPLPRRGSSPDRSWLCEVPRMKISELEQITNVCD